MRKALPFIAVGLFVVGIGVCIWLIAGAQVTNRESALLSILIGFLSVTATWLVAHRYSESQHRQAIEEVQELHRTNLRTYALKAAEKVDNLSTELNRLSVYLTDELESDDDDESIRALHSRDERIESAVHILHTLKSMNDTALSDWEGVIGDEIEQHREQRREREEELGELLADIESVVERQRQDVIGGQLDTDILRSELVDLRAELRRAMVDIGGTAIPPKSRRRKVRHKLTMTCPECEASLSYRQRENERTVKAVNCKNCNSRWISRYSDEEGFFLEAREIRTETVDCPKCGDTSDVDLDSCPGNSSTYTCPACDDTIRVVRTLEGFDVRTPATTHAGKPRKELTPKFLDEVKALLPPQPWPKGIHREIAEKLGVTSSTISRANNQLIQRGDFLPQYDGIVYAPVKPSTKPEESNGANEGDGPNQA